MGIKRSLVRNSNCRSCHRSVVHTAFQKNQPTQAQTIKNEYINLTDKMHSLSVKKILIEGTQKTLYQNTGQDPLYLIRSSGSKHKASVCPLEHADTLH